jgi:hypothetical protein
MKRIGAQFKRRRLDSAGEATTAKPQGIAPFGWQKLKECGLQEGTEVKEEPRESKMCMKED